MDKLQEMEHAAREIAKTLDRAIRGFNFKVEPPGEKWGFALMLFSFKGPEFTWISNAEREDMIKVMKEFIARNSPHEVYVRPEPNTKWAQCVREKRHSSFERCEYCEMVTNIVGPINAKGLMEGQIYRTKHEQPVRYFRLVPA